MTLAFQCGRWDLDVFEEEISAAVMTRWCDWFRRRPQGQYQNDKMLARFAAAALQSKGADLNDCHFMVDYDLPEPEDTQNVDDLCDAALADVPKKFKQPKLEVSPADAGHDASHEADRRLDDVHGGDGEGTK